MDELPTQDEIMAIRKEGAEIADLDEAYGEQRKYVLVAYELYASGATSNFPVMDQDIATAIGERMGIGEPTDPAGYGIWEVPAA